MTTPDVPLEVSCAESARMRAAGEAFILVDCRESDEAAICRIEGSQLLPMSELTEGVGELAGREGERIVVYCHLGGRSYRVAAWLRQQGFSQAQSMAGGIDQWAVEVDPGMPRY